MKKRINDYPSSIDFCSLEPNWRLFLLRGIISIIFGSIAVFMPAATVIGMTLLFGTYSLLDGIFSIGSGIYRARKGKPWGGLILSGILGIAVGLIVLIMPQVASIGMTAFLWSMVSFWAISTGIFELISAVRLYKEIRGEWLLALNGVISIIMAISAIVLIVVNPLASIITLGLLIGVDALTSGVTLLMLAFRLRKREKSLSL